MNKKCWHLLTLVSLTACSLREYTPTVDAWKDPNAYRIDQDMSECKSSNDYAFDKCLRDRGHKVLSSNYVQPDTYKSSANSVSPSHSASQEIGVNKELKSQRILTITQQNLDKSRKTFDSPNKLPTTSTIYCEAENMTDGRKYMTQFFENTPENSFDEIRHQWEKYFHTIPTVQTGGWTASQGYCFSNFGRSHYESALHERDSTFIKTSIIDWMPSWSNQSVSRQNQSSAYSSLRSQKRAELAEQYGARFAEQQMVSDYSSNQPANNGKKRLVLKDYGKQCIRPVDIRMDKDIKGMFWYKMENNCSETLQVSWCDFDHGKSCPASFNSAWNIRGNESYEAWSDVDPKSGRYHLSWLACQKMYQGREVYVDHKKEQCWSWSE